MRSGLAPAKIMPGVIVTLRDEPDCVVPAGQYRVSRLNADGSFHVGGRTAVWPSRLCNVDELKSFQ